MAIGRILDLEPALAILTIQSGLALGDNSFEVPSADFRKQFLSRALDVLSIKQPWTLRGPDESRQLLLSLDKGPLPQVLAIKSEKVERVKDWFPFPAEQLVELANALRIDANNLAVNDGFLDGQLGDTAITESSALQSWTSYTPSMPLFSRSKNPPWLDSAREFCNARNITIMGWGPHALVVEAKSSERAAEISTLLANLGFRPVADPDDSYAGILTLSIGT